MRHFLTFNDFSKGDILEIIQLSKKIKSEKKSGVNIPYLDKQVLGMIFEKSSTRTRVSFEAGMFQLGGSAIFLANRDIQLSRGEPIQDTSIVISSMVDMVMLRTNKHSTLENFAKSSSVPVINGLTDLCHPVQILADYLTILEEGFNNPAIAYIGDGNNMANSWIAFAEKMDLELRVATPKNYEPHQKSSSSKISFTNSPEEAIKNADVVITDTWVSMGMEKEQEERIQAFQGFTITQELFSKASENSIFLHCLPAYRGKEVVDEVIDGERSRIYPEAENRLHAQKGLMVWLNEKRGK